MPNMDGTGPRGMGPMTGRRRGFCEGAVPRGGGMGLGIGWGRGRGAGMCRFFAPVTGTKEMLNARKAMLQSQLEEIDRQLQDE